MVANCLQEGHVSKVFVPSREHVRLDLNHLLVVGGLEGQGVVNPSRASDSNPRYQVIQKCEWLSMFFEASKCLRRRLAQCPLIGGFINFLASLLVLFVSCSEVDIFQSRSLQV